MVVHGASSSPVSAGPSQLEVSLRACNNPPCMGRLVRFLVAASYLVRRHAIGARLRLLLQLLLPLFRLIGLRVL